MVSSKSTTFVFLLVFISISLNTSLAYTNQATRKVAVRDENGFTMTSGSSLTLMEQKEIVNDGNAVSKGKMEGRKMMVERREISKDKKKEEDEGLTTATASGNGNSEYSVGNFSHKGQGKMRMQRKLRIRSTDSNKNNPGGFMAFNADYHMARPHPPKNN